MINKSQLKYFLAVFFIYACIVLISALRQNPRLEVINLNNRQQPTMMPWTLPVRFALDKDHSTAPTFEYRGENRQGIVMSSVSISKLTEQWRIAPLNIGVHVATKSVPAVDESGIYVGSDSGWFFKFDEQGQKQWSYFASTSNKGFHATAALDQKFVYVAAYNGILYCLRKNDGALVWTHQVADYIGSSVLLRDNFIYVGAETESNGFVAKLDASTGELMWRTAFTGAPVHSSPMVDDRSGTVIVGNISGRIQGFDIKTGKEKWEFAAQGAVKTTPSFSSNIAYIGSHDGNVYALEAASGKLFWKMKFADKVFTSISIDDGLNLGIVTVDKKIIAFDLKNGETKWFQSGGEGMNVSSSLIVKTPKGDLVLAACKESSLCAYDIKKGKELFSVPMKGVLSSMPSIFNDFLYVSLDEQSGLVKYKIIP